MYRLLSFVSIFLFTSIYAYADKSDCIQHHCLAVIDAGSSGSRLHIYAYDLDKTNTPIQINEIWNRKVVPGLAAIEHDNGPISAYMEKLFTDAPAALMPVYFYSTAGMRLLPKSHYKSVNQLVADWFDRQYYWRLVSARTISGREEGLYGWLAINYLLKLLDQTEKPLVGAMDIGGASVQITFPMTNDANIDNEDKISFDLYGRHFVLFSHSFLGLGQVEMGHQYFDLNICYPNEYELPSGQKGQGDSVSCQKEISTLVNKVHYVNKKVKSVIALNPIENWYITGGLSNLLNDKIFALTKQQFTIQDLSIFADKNICHQKWSTLEELYPNNFMVFNYCMLTSYLYALIVNGYGLAGNQTINFMPLNKPADWAMGVVLQHHKT